MDLLCRILKLVLAIVTSLLLVNQGSTTCKNGEFTCNNGLCIPEMQFCDFNDDCGDYSDEHGDCTLNEACLHYIWSIWDVPCKFPDADILYTNFNATDRLSFVFDIADVGGMTTIEADRNIVSSGIVRFNIMTPLDERVVFIYSGETRASLRIPLVVHRGDVVTITMERSEDPRSMPWIAGFVPPCNIAGFLENRPCSLNTTCREWVMTSTPPEIDKCFPVQVLKFGLKWFKKCLPFCLEETFTDPDEGQLTFPRTNARNTAYSVEKCPSSDVPLASRACAGGFTQWEDPVLNDCPSNETGTLESLAELYRNSELEDSDVILVSDMVVDETGRAKNNGDDLELTVTLLEKIVAVESPSVEVTTNVLQIVDNIFSNKEDNFAEIEPSRILLVIQNQLTNFQVGDEQTNFTFVGSSVAAQAIQIDPSILNSALTYGALFSSSDKESTEPFSAGETFLETGMTSADETENVRSTVALPAAMLKKIKTGPNGTIPITFSVYRPSLVFNKSPTINALPETVGSVILSARIEGHTIRDLEDPVILRFHTNYNESETNVDNTKQCVFWKYASNGIKGRWSSAGCQVQNGPANDDEESITECHCDHLTNFAVLIDVQGDINNAALDVLSMIGCTVSIIALIVTIITFLTVKKLRQRRAQQILLNLCFALLGLYLFFLFGINRIQTDIGCVIFGALIHFFCLSSLAWMAVEATNMYLLFVRVFDSGMSRFMWKAMLIGWGLPFVAVLLCAVITPQNYRSTYCFPRAGTPTFNFGVFLLVACILFYNIVIFSVVFYKLFLVRTQIKSTSNSRQDVIRQAQNAVAISVLLGLTWIFGFFSLAGARFIFNLLFLVFCSLQGLFVFLLFCLRQKEARDAWKNCFRCKKKKTTIASTDYTLATMASE